MAEALIITFIVTLIPVLIALGASYYNHKELYRLLYILSIYAYVHVVAYAIDTFSLSRNGVLLLLIASAVFLIAIGKYVYG